MKSIDIPPCPSPSAALPTAEALPLELPPADDVSPLTFNRTVLPGMLAVRESWLPFLLLQACGLGLVISYYRWPAAHRLCDEVAALKHRGGFLFAAVVMSLSSGLMPEVFKLVTGVDRRLDRQRARDVVFVMAMYACAGVLADGFYRLMAWLYGSGVDLKTIFAKVSTDQFIYSPVLGIGFIATAFAWRRARYDTGGVLRSMGPRWYGLTIVPMLLPCWAYWIPMTSLMYALPPGLTFCYGAIAAGAIALVYTSIAAAHDAEHGPHPAV